MATYQEIYNLSKDQNFFNKTVVAVVQAAKAILVEDKATPGHTQRLAWAAEALAHPDAVAETLRWSVVADAGAGLGKAADAADTDLQKSVDDLINPLLGL